jgi:hypothetical protein
VGSRGDIELEAGGADRAYASGVVRQQEGEEESSPCWYWSAHQTQLFAIPQIQLYGDADMRIVIPLFILLIIIGGCIWFLFNQYRAVVLMYRTHYRHLADSKIPAALSKQAQTLTDLNFRFVAAYIVEIMQGAVTKNLRTVYVFDSDDGFTKATIVQIAYIKGTAFETIYPDGMLLITTHGLPAGLTANVSKNELYQALVAKGTLQQAWEDHNPQVAALRAFHGTPVQARTPEEILWILNEHIMPRDQVHIAHLIARQLRLIGLTLAAIVVLFLVIVVAMYLLGYIFTSTAGVIGVVIVITALVLAARIKRKYLQS